MSKPMTDEEIAAEQALMMKQRADERFNFDRVAEEAPPITEEAADKVTPLDLLDSDNYTTKEIRNERFDICKGCDRLFKPTRTCKECGCFMALKTWIANASCALHDDPKWGPVAVIVRVPR